MDRLTLLGVKVDTLSIGELNHLVSRAINNGENILIANHNLHSIYLYHHDEMMRNFYQRADYIHIDGMPLLMWGRLLGYPLKREQRVTYVDWIHPLMAMAEREGFRVFYVGGKPGVAVRAAEILCARYPALKIQTHHGYFTEEENKVVLDKIRDFQTQILIVGMGMPRQEHWVADNLENITANVILTAGACFDYIAGVIPTPPRWMGRLGLEWLYRLFSEPRRLAKRYLVEPWALLPLAINDILKKSRL
jgi:N-acetylglucosaminyldiphosphoundecaprenol N-acetyl-beta-D-mannosaminyltransferase